MTTALVIGPSGFLGSHVVRDLVDHGVEVRVLSRASSSLVAIEGLPVQRFTGELDDADTVRAAMTGCDVVFHCVVEARPWLRDPSSMVRTNVEGLRSVLDVAVHLPLTKFVLTSSIATLPIHAERLVSEEDGPHNWVHLGGAYVQTRIDAEELLLRACRERGLPGVAMCVANTYGPGDLLPTPHGGMLADAARGAMPVYVRGAGAEVVDVRDAARALVLAAQRGRVGERYIVSERWMLWRDLHQLAADATGARGPRFGVPKSLLTVAGSVGDQVARLTRRDVKVNLPSMRLMHVMTPLDHGKAVRELGWEPRPITESVREAALWFTRDAVDPTPPTTPRSA